MTDWGHVDRWLTELRRRRWMVYAHGDRTAPNVLGAVYHRDRCADVVIMHGHDRAFAYRTPTSEDGGVFDPQWVYWWFAHGAVATLHAVLTLAPPPAHTKQLYLCPPGARIEPEHRQLVTIRPAQ